MSAAARLGAAVRLLGHIRDRLGLEFGFVLWNGATVPRDLPEDALAIVCGDESVIAALLRRPNIDTLANLWVAGRLDLRGGSIFDLVRLRPSVRSKALLRSLDKRMLIANLWRFLFLSRGRPFPLESVPDAGPRSDANIDVNKTNIQYHYDLSNDFYALFLDPEMVYSCGYFQSFDNDLATAQRDKLDMICRKLRLRPEERLLDIGCGWGALICHAALHFGVRAHGVTLSEEQYALAQAKIERLGLGNSVTVELRDYTTLDGPFDKIASIGMFEHVGLANHPLYFRTIARLLKPGGLYLHHAIARPAKGSDRRFRRGSTEFKALARYIFPGAEADHIGMSAANLQRFGFEVHDVEGWREHYARTCRLWHDRLLARLPEAEQAVGSVKTRLMLAYLAGCSLAFERNTLGIYQTLASKRVRGPSGLPPTRADLYA